MSANGGELKKLAEGGDGNFAGDYTLGQDIKPKDEKTAFKSISVFGSKDGHHYEGLWVYQVK